MGVTLISFTETVSYKSYKLNRFQIYPNWLQLDKLLFRDLQDRCRGVFVLLSNAVFQFGLNEPTIFFFQTGRFPDLIEHIYIEEECF